MHFDERELTFEFVAVHDEFYFPAGDFIRGIVAFSELVRTLVPNDDFTGAVMTLRNDSFKRAVIERMILDVHCEPLVAGIERRSFGHGPRRKYAFCFQTKIVMQSRRAMLLHDECERPRALAHGAGRFRRRFEVALSLVFL